MQIDNDILFFPFKCFFISKTDLCLNTEKNYQETVSSLSTFFLNLNNSIDFYIESS